MATWCPYYMREVIVYIGMQNCPNLRKKNKSKVKRTVLLSIITVFCILKLIISFQATDVEHETITIPG